MIEALNVTKISCINNQLICLFHDLFLKIKILHYQKSYFLATTKKIKIFVVFDFSCLNQFVIYGFKTEKEQIIFKQFLAIKNINFKTSYKILNTFSLIHLQELAFKKDFAGFKKKLKFQDLKINALFNIVLQIKNQLNDLDLKIIEDLVSYGFVKSQIITTLNEIKKIINYSKLSFNAKVNLLLSTLSKNEANKT